MAPPLPRWRRGLDAPVGIPVFLFVALLAISRADPPTKILDLATTIPSVAGDVTRVYGSTGNGSSGVPVTGGSDVNGDGYPDTAFAQIRESPPGMTNSGQVTVVFGNGTIGDVIDTAAPPPATILEILGAHEYEVAGGEVWIDDVTGDGLGDIIIGRQNYTLNYNPADPPNSGGAYAAGALTIIPGDADLPSLGTLDLAAPPMTIKMMTLLGEGDHVRLGIWMRTGDIDGDGTADLVVGADETDAPGEPVTENSGAVWVIRGGMHLVPEDVTPHVVVDLANFGSTALEGNLARLVPPAGSPDAHLGATVQVGDLDGNGRAEVISAATLRRAGAGLSFPTSSPWNRPVGTGEASGGTDNGTLFISWDENFPPCPWPAGYCFTVTEPLLGDFTRIDGIDGALLPENDSFGEEIITGEFNGDGFPELYTGDLVGDTFNGPNSGLGHLLYTAANLRGRTIVMTAPPPADVPASVFLGPITGAIGNDTVARGDFDNDGIDDLAVGNPHDAPQGRIDAGSVHVLYGQPGGWPATVDQKSSNLPGPDELRICRIDGAFPADVLCYSAASGDLDDDGIVDFIVNEMLGNGFGGSPSNVGNLVVINGTAMLDPLVPSLSFGVAGPVEFGAQDIGAGATGAIDLVMTNVSGAAVTFSSLGLAGPQAGSFSIVSDTGEVVLAPAASRTVSVSFDPAVVGAHGAGLQVLTDVDAHVLGVGLRGAGIVPSLEAEVVDYQRFGAAACLRFRSQIGYLYVLQRCDDLASWGTIQSGIAGTGGIVPLFDFPGAGGPRQYYRVVGTPVATP